MKLHLSSVGNRKESNERFTYLMNYMYGVADNLRDKECLYSAEVIGKQISSLNAQHLMAIANNQFVEGWG